MKKSLLLLLLTGILIPVFLLAASKYVIYEEPKSKDISDEVVINKVVIAKEESDILEVEIHYSVLTKDIQSDAEIWVRPDHSNSEFEWDSAKAYSGDNVVNLEMNLNRDRLKELGIKSIESNFLKIIIDVKSDRWFKKNIPFTKLWKSD